MATAPRLPDYRGGAPVAAQVARGGRLPASEINRMAPTVRERTISVAAHGEPIPIVYGRANVPGLLFAQGMIGSDLVLGYALCVGEIDAIEMVQINDVDASTISGVTVTTYRGLPTQTVNGTLSSAIGGFADSMRFDAGNGLRGIAYVVLRITTAAAVGGFPRLRATIRGRKVFDPRTDTTVYSDNTALCIGDLITDLDYGLGATVTNLSAAADWCDTLLADATTKRSRISLVLASPQRILPDWLDLLTMYAECWYVHEGASIRLVPDNAVTLSSTPIVTNWLRSSLSIRHEDASDAPTSITVHYTVPRSDALPWSTTTARRASPGADVNPSTVRLPGVITAAEADNKALGRLNRTRSRRTVSFTVPDSGVVYQPGDVVRLDNGPRGVALLPVRVLSIDLAEPGRYGIRGEVYNADHYPAELPPPAPATLPSGAIVIWDGGEIPTNFSAFSAANGKLLVGAGGAYAQGASGGTGWNVTITGTTTTNGAHSTWTSEFQDYFSSPSQSNPELGTPAGSTGDPAHAHGFTAGPVTLNPLRAQRRLIQATTSVATIPSGAKLFGVAGLVGAGWERDTAANGRTIEAAATTASVGVASHTLDITLASADDTHRHFGAPAQFTEGAPPTYHPDWPGYEIFYYLFEALAGGGPHTHTDKVKITASLKRRRLALYGASAAAPLLPGHIVLWQGGAVPADWLLCDGTNGTPDCRDFFIEIAGTGNEGTSAGDNTASVVSQLGYQSSVSHQHRGPQRPTTYRVRGNYGHIDNIRHSHRINASAAISPPYYALALIMYSPGI